MPERCLLLIRHATAEAVVSQSGARDFDRPLAPRGQADAAVIGEWLSARDHVPDLAVLSPSLRTRQTWEHACEGLGREVPRVLDGRIYENRVSGLLAIISETDESVTVLALVGHNPSLQELANMLAGDHSIGEFPTAAVAVFDVTCEWSDVDGRPTSLSEVMVCRA